MTTRRTGVLTALITTAALFLCLPGLLRSLTPADSNRMHESLRPPRLRTLTVRLLPGETEDRKLISQLCTVFEKTNPGVRIFLRSVDAEEFLSPSAVLPDAALYETGSLNIPEKVFLPLAGETESSGMFSGVSYAVPLWLSPNVLSIPVSWLQEAHSATPRPDSLLAASTAQPAKEMQAMLENAFLPWDRLAQPGAIASPRGVALSQLLSMCPYPLRKQLPDAVQTHEHSICARVQTLGRHLSSVRKGENLIPCVLEPAVSDHVRYVSLCRDSEDARAFVHFLRTGLTEEALALGLIPLREEIISADPLVQQAVSLFQRSHTLPNAFAHTRQELESLCLQGFQSLTDPVETLLRLR